MILALYAKRKRGSAVSTSNRFRFEADELCDRTRAACDAAFHRAHGPGWYPISKQLSDEPAVKVDPPPVPPMPFVP